MATKKFSKRIRSKREKVAKVLTPGRQPQFEDMDIRHTSLSLKAQPERTTAPRIVSSCRVPRAQVHDRLMTAMKTLRALPDREKRFFVVKSSSPEYVQEYIDAYNSVDEVMQEFRPSPEEVSDCLVALSWVRHLEKRAWQILWWRSFELSFGLIARYIGRSDETARKRFDEAITDAWIAANGA